MLARAETEGCRASDAKTKPGRTQTTSAACCALSTNHWCFGRVAPYSRRAGCTRYTRYTHARATDDCVAVCKLKPLSRKSALVFAYELPPLRPHVPFPCTYALIILACFGRILAPNHMGLDGGCPRYPRLASHPPPRWSWGGSSIYMAIIVGAVGCILGMGGSKSRTSPPSPPPRQTRLPLGGHTRCKATEASPAADGKGDRTPAFGPFR